MIRPFFEFETLELAQAAIAKINASLGLPKPNSVTQTYCDVMIFGDVYLIPFDSVTASQSENWTESFLIDDDSESELEDIIL